MNSFYEAQGRIDFSAIKNGKEALRGRLLVVIGGRVRPRTNPLSLRAICKFFSGTPNPFIKDCLDDLLAEGKVDIRRNGLSRRAGYVYQPGGVV